MGNSGVEPSGYDLSQYADTIAARLFRFRAPEESESSLMHWYGENDSVNDKVHSVFFAAEERDGEPIPALSEQLGARGPELSM